MKHKVSELEGVLLDAAVAKATGDDWRLSPDYRADMESAPYSGSWEHGGPIIERDRLWVGYCGDEDTSWPGQWFAQYGERVDNFHSVGATPLIAAMRAYVASKYDLWVELP